MSRTSRGTSLSNELLEQLADEAEQGYRPEQLRRRGRPRLAKGEGPSHTLNVRIDDDLRDGLADRARREGHTTSEVVREALRRYLAS
jgi:CRISPR-associated endonuclease/helicase Cas3